MNSVETHIEGAPSYTDSAPKKKRSFLTPSFVLLFVAHLTIVSVYFLFITTMARHAIQAFACADSIAGLVASIFLVGAAFSRVLAGRYADALGLKRCSIAALLVTLACCLLYPVADMSLPLMLVVRFVHGAAFGFGNTAMPAIATEIIPTEVMGEGTGWFMLSNSLSTGIGPLLGLLVAGNFDYTTLYLVSSALMVVALVAILFLSAGKAPEQGSRAAVKELPTFKLSQILDPSTRRFSFYMFLAAFSYSSINSFIDAYSTTIGLEGWTAFVFLIYSGTLIIIRPPVGRLQDRRGENAVLYASLVCVALTAFTCAACSIAPLPPLLLLVGFFAALGFGTCMSSGLAVIGRLSGGSKAAPGIATFYLLCDFGCGVGPFILGFVVGSLGFPAMYVVCGLIGIVGVVYYHFAHGRHVRR